MDFKLGRRETGFLHPAGELIVERHELATPELEAIHSGTTTYCYHEAHRCLIALSDLCVHQHIAASIKWIHSELKIEQQPTTCRSEYTSHYHTSISKRLAGHLFASV